jgi:hypothetical protein
LAKADKLHPRDRRLMVRDGDSLRNLRASGDYQDYRNSGSYKRYPW